MDVASNFPNDTSGTMTATLYTYSDSGTTQVGSASSASFTVTLPENETTMPTIEIPGWLEACRPDDDLYADAYEGTPAELRALLKTAIAYAFHRWPLADDEKQTPNDVRNGRCFFKKGLFLVHSSPPSVSSSASASER